MTGPSSLRSLLSAVAAVVAVTAWSGTAAAAVPGDPDPGFGADGASLYQLGSGSSPASQIKAVALQPDGKILVAGWGTDKNGNHAFMVARLTADGLLDQTFGTAGKVLTQLGGAGAPTPTSEATALAVQPDGKIIVGGDNYLSSSGFLLARLNPNGTFDTSFGKSGKVFDPAPADLGYIPSPLVSAIALQPDGKIVVAGNYENYHAFPLFVARINGSNGTLDKSFGQSGVIIDLLQGQGLRPFAGADAVALQPDGKIVIGGSVGGYGYGMSVLVARLNGGDGSYDQSFGNQGIVRWDEFDTNCADHFGVANALGLQPDGKLVVAGATSGDPPDCNPPVSPHRAPTLVSRLNGSNGSFDQSFGSGGTILSDLGAGSRPFASYQGLALQPNGQIVVGGMATDASGNNQVLVARLNGTDGSFDNAFAGGGSYLHQFANGSGAASGVNAIALQPDGNIVAAGYAGSQALIIRLIGQTATPGQGGSPGGGTPNGSGNPPKVTLAVVSKLGLAPAAFRAAGSGGSIARLPGTIVSYRDNRAATTRFTVLRPVRGVKSGGRCVKKSHGRRGRSCTRYVVVGGFSHRDVAGLNRFRFTGRIHGRKLKPGPYRLRAVPHFAGHAGRAAVTGFRIVR